jgi:hypothetical protein
MKHALPGTLHLRKQSHARMTASIRPIQPDQTLSIFRLVWRRLNPFTEFRLSDGQSGSNPMCPVSHIFGKFGGEVADNPFSVNFSPTFGNDKASMSALPWYHQLRLNLAFMRGWTPPPRQLAPAIVERSSPSPGATGIPMPPRGGRRPDCRGTDSERAAVTGNGCSRSLFVA